MTSEPQVSRVVEKALEHKGLLPLEFLLAEFVPADRLRSLARTRGLSPKGFRVDVAPPRAIAQAIVRDLQPELLAEAATEIVMQLRARAATPAPAPVATPSDAAGPAATTGDKNDKPRAVIPDFAALTAELERMRAQQTATLTAQQRAEARVAELESRSAQQAQLIVRLRGDVEAATKRGSASPSTPDRDVVRALHEAEAELEVAARNETDYRMRLAEQQTTIRTLTQRVEELEAMLPKDRRRKTPPPPPPPVAERFRIPFFTAEFYRSLETRDQRAVESAFDAVFRLATAGYAYPGLEVKQLEGVDLWSMRAGIKVRVYFRPRPDGHVDILAVGDREEQDTLLRRLR